ncbi:MAG: TonB-linked outer membrane protein, SusC/RagA family [Bacteroidetes bacterium]|nr:TonB-linked outer membrane protein, SusC/RagA family [Bacteroidota bacterium]MBP1676649.1 TonB-linked outer membrane protein, SusC/RagA family [Bacteroidota bacterium]
MKRKLIQISLGRSWKILSICFLLTMFASQLNAQITIQVQNKPIKEILKIIETKSNYRFFYNEGLKGLDKVSSLQVKNAGINEVMRVVLQNTEINYKVEDTNLIVLMARPDKESNETSRISGTVTDMNGVAIIGATVVEKNSKKGTITNYDGAFSIEASPDATLVISYIGYQTVELKAGSQKILNIKLSEDVKNLSEIVVTALGIKREEKALGYSVQAVKGEGLQTVKGVDMATSLSGQVSGLRVMNTTEFTDESSLVLRGETPLLVVDGVPYGNMRLRDVPADDIESVSVLKGATASALYGANGGSGAIMITTKKGLKKSGLSVSFNSSTMFNAGFVALPEVQSKFGRTFTQRSDGSYEVTRNAVYSFGQPFEGQLVYQWDPVTKGWGQTPTPYLAKGKDNFKNFLEQGYVLNNNLSITQQGENGSFRTSASWVENKGIYPNSMFDKITFSTGGEMKFKKMQITSNLTYNKQSTPNKGFGGYKAYDPMYSLLIRGTIDYDIRDYKDYWLVPNESQNNSYSADVQNAYFDRYERTNGFNRDIFNGNVTVNYDISPELKALVRVGYDTYSVRSEIKVSKGNYQSAGTASIAGIEVWGESLKGSYNVGIDRGYSLNSDGILMYNKTIKDFTIDALAGISTSIKRDESVYSFTQGGLSIPGYFSLNASVNPKTAGEVLIRRQTNSAYGKGSVSWKNILFMDGTIRNDWVSTLPSSTRSYLYPSLSGSFIASELLKKYDWLSLWKLRGSWTSVKVPANPYAINTVLGITNPAWGTLSAAYAPTTYRPTDLLPQAATTLEIGSNINLMKNRVSFDIAYYEKKGYDYIVSSSIAPSSGYSAIYRNSDEERTRKGFELSLKGTPIRTKKLKWDIMANWSKDAQYYTKIDPLYTTNVTKPWVGVGKRTDVFVSQDYLKNAEGEIIHINGIPQYSSYTSSFGFSDPDWIWGLTNSVSYKNFKFNISIDGRVGGLITSYTSMYLWNTGNHIDPANDAIRVLDAKDNTVGHYVGDGVKIVSGAATFDANGNILTDTRVYATNDVATTYRTYIQNYHKSIAWGGNPSPPEIFDGTFLKIREVSLTYDLPTTLINKVKLKSASISIIGQNVFMWAKDFKYSDPDGGVENFADPSQRYVGFNVKLDF